VVLYPNVFQHVQLIRIRLLELTNLV
jgi:hypothetical protein